MLDTGNELLNRLGVADELNLVGLVPDGVLEEEDLTNWAAFSIGLGYDPAPVAPTAAFVYAPDSLNPLQILFHDTSAGGPTSWAWDFGDPASGAENSSTLQDPTHFFSGFGTFEVTLTATNAEGSSSVTQSITIVDPGLPFTPNNYHVAQAKRRLLEQFRVRGV